LLYVAQGLLCGLLSNAPKAEQKQKQKQKERKRHQTRARQRMMCCGDASVFLRGMRPRGGAAARRTHGAAGARAIGAGCARAAALRRTCSARPQHLRFSHTRRARDAAATAAHRPA
jgi:hypothetical protein